MKSPGPFKAKTNTFAFAKASFDARGQFNVSLTLRNEEAKALLDVCAREGIERVDVVARAALLHGLGVDFPELEVCSGYFAEIDAKLRGEFRSAVGRAIDEVMLMWRLERREDLRSYLQRRVAAPVAPEEIYE